MKSLVCLASLLLVTPALAADGGDSPKPKRVCKSVQPPTGSRMGVRSVCKTAAEWDSDRLAAERDMEFRSRSGANASSTNGGGEPR